MSTSTSISAVHARRVLDSRGRPTVEAEVTLAGGAVGRAIAPAGASRGSREAVDLRDGGSRLGGYDVGRAVENVKARSPGRWPAATRWTRPTSTRCWSRSTARRTSPRWAATRSSRCRWRWRTRRRRRRALPLWRHLAGRHAVALPLPEIQIFGGGAHAGRRVDVQDFMVMPVGAWNFADALSMVAEVYRAAGEVMAEAGRLAGVADEGGWWPLFDSNEQALDTLLYAIERAGARPGTDVAISLDIAASELGRDGVYTLGLDRRTLDRDQLAEMYARWLDRYPIASIEDPFGEDDRVGWVAFTHAFGRRVQIIGDDYLTTSAARVDAAAADRACNAVLLKPNQAGTLTETRAAMDAARRAGMATIVSARSGETEDVSIAHLAVGWNAGQLKVGSFARSERMAKWNEVLRIEEALGDDARFAGASALAVPWPPG